MKRTVPSSLLLGLIAGLTAAFTSSAGTIILLPRYHLAVGQELVYEGSSRFKYERGVHGTTDKTTLWVAAQNKDQSWHIIAHNENTFASMHGTNDGPLPQGQKRETFGAFDLYPDGHIGKPPEGNREEGLSSMFPPLPADLPSAERGWELDKGDGDKARFRLNPQSDAAAGKWVFDRSDEGLQNEVYLSTSKAVIHFDASRGFITKVEGENTQGYGVNGKGTGGTELKSDSKKDPEWIAQLSREAEVLSKAKAAVRDAGKVLRQGGDAQKTTESTEKLLLEGRAQVKLPVIVAQFDAQLKDFKSSAAYFAEEKQHEDEVLNKPAADWSVEDIDGKKHSLEDYRGKVVVLDFWYRGCGWCIKAMPQIKEVVTHYEGKPVVVLGMNTDREEKDARFVVDKLKLNYTTLKAEGWSDKYGVQGFPTLVVIDQKGVVRGRHVGYSPTLREELIKQIDGLLGGGK